MAKPILNKPSYAKKPRVALRKGKMAKPILNKPSNGKSREWRYERK